VQEGHHDPAGLSAGLPLASTSPGYFVIRASFSSIDPGSAAHALHSRDVSADRDWLHLKPQTSASTAKRQGPRPETPVPRTGRPFSGRRFLVRDRSARDTNPITGECVTGRPEVLSCYPASRPARVTTEPSVAG
jgi:hypothetical protein